MAAEPSLSPRALLAIEAVRRGVDVVRRRVGAEEVASKGGRDVVTGTDVAAEVAIRDVLAADGAPVIGEEGGGEAPPGAARWLVDPLCGTRNHASGIPLVSVNVGLLDGDRMALGACGDPATGEVVVAEAGAGAWAVGVRDDGGVRRLRAGTGSGIVVVEEGPSTGRRRRQAAGLLAAVVEADRWDLRALGTSGCLPLLAAGRIDAYACLHLTALHSGAGCLVALEAGAVLTDADGAAWTPAATTLVAAADADLHADLLVLARAADPGPGDRPPGR